MHNPKIIEEVVPEAIYRIPTYKITNAGVEDGEGLQIAFCKGNKEHYKFMRQEGVFTETLIKLAETFLEEVNQGDKRTKENSMAITKLEEALMWLDKRTADRELRGVKNTYKP